MYTYLYIFWSYRYPVVPELFVEKNMLSPLNCLHIFVRDQLTIFVWVYFWALYSVPLIYLYILLTTPHCLVYCSFRVNLEDSQCQSSNFVPLLQYCVGSSGSFV